MDQLCSLADLKAYLEGLAAEEEAERAAGREVPPSPEIARALPVPPDARVRQAPLWKAKEEASAAHDAAQAARLREEHGDPLIPGPARAEGWTPARQKAFLEHLAETGSVGAAAARVGLSRASALRLRESAHPAFARAWKQATRIAYCTLRDAAMERAIAGRQVPLYSGGRVVGEQTVHDERLVVYLLRTRGARRVTEALAPAAPGQLPTREYVEDGLYDEYAMTDFARSLALFEAPPPEWGGPAPAAAPSRPRTRGSRSHHRQGRRTPPGPAG